MCAGYATKCGCIPQNSVNVIGFRKEKVEKVVLAIEKFI